MRWLAFFCLCALFVPAAWPAGDPVKQAPLKITPGKAIVPKAMRRIWGELLTLDRKTRTGTFRNENNDQVMPFVVLPYAELLHHAAHGDLQDFKIGERALFRLHQNEKGQWMWLTYIQDEMNFLAAHREYYWVDSLDPAKGKIACTEGKADKKSVNGKGLILETDQQTRYWKEGRPAKFTDVRVGDKLRAKTHGVGKGKHYCCWEVFLDDASLARFQKEQRAVHSKRLAEEGWTGYVDASGPGEVRLTLFHEGMELAKDLKVGQTVRLAPAGADRKAGKTVEGTLKGYRRLRKLHEVTITLKSAPPEPLVVAGVARLWLTP